MAKVNTDNTICSWGCGETITHTQLLKMKTSKAILEKNLVVS